MSTTFDTIQPVMGGPVPVHPQPSIYESIKIEREQVNGVFFDHVTVEMIRDRPTWDYEEARARLEPAVQAALAKPKRTPRKRTPKKKAAPE